MILSFELIENENITDGNRKIFADFLKKQNKVKGDLLKKADRCKLICIVKQDNLPIAIGAIKQKTSSDFSILKANLPNMESLFELELGYFFTCKTAVGKGIANQMAKLLLSEFKDENLMATTEIKENPSMVTILLRNGFNLYGSPFKSQIHENVLGLFLKFK